MTKPAGEGVGPGTSMLVLAFVLLSYSLAQTTLLPALADLIRGLHTNSNDVAWTLTGFFISAAVATPILGRLGDMFGRRRMAIIATLAFGGGAIVVAVTSNLWVAVAGRTLQGIGAAVFPLCFSIARDLFPPQRTARNIGLLSATNGIGAALGLVIGGLIADHVSYHWIFWVSALMAIAGALLLHFLVPESEGRRGGSVDVRGAVLLAIGLTVPLFAISRASTWGWESGRTLGLIAGGLLILTGWVRLQQRTERPLADIAALRSAPVLMTNLATVFVGYGMLSSFIMLPQLASAPTSTGYGLGLSATGVGLVIVPGAFVMMVFGPVSGTLGTRFGNKVPLVAGGILITIGFVLLALAHHTRLEVIVFAAIMSGGIGLSFAALTNLIIDSVEPAKTAEATGFNAVLLRIGMSLGAQVSSSILAGSAVAGAALASNSGYTHAFLLSAGVALVGTIVALLVPKPRRRTHRPLLEEIGIASSATEPPFVPSASKST
jgi:MFS family permease